MSDDAQRAQARFDRTLVFPEYVGPSIAGCTTMLLWLDKLAVSMPSYLLSDREEPFKSFATVGNRAHETGNPLEKLFAAVDHHYGLAQQQAIAEIKALKPLGDRIQTVATVQPGTPEAYSTLDAFLPVTMPHAVASMSNPQFVNIGAMQFLWRVFEAWLLVEDADKVLDILEVRAERLGGPELLIADGIILQHSLGRIPDLSIAIRSPHSLGILAEYGRTMETTPAEVAEEMVEQLAFSIFDEVTRDHVPFLFPENLDKVIHTFEASGDNLDAARRKCRNVARELHARAQANQSAQQALRDTLPDLKKEAQSLLSIDSKTLADVFTRLPESAGLWALFGAIAGTATGAIPPIAAASAAVAAFSLLGSSALKASRERREALQKSPWSFLYYLNR